MNSSKCKLELGLILVDISSGLRGTNLPTVAQHVTLSPATWPLTATSHTLRIRDRESAKCSFYHPSRGKDLEQNCSTRSADPSGTETKLLTSLVSHHRVLWWLKLANAGFSIQLLWKKTYSLFLQSCRYKILITDSSSLELKKKTQFKSRNGKKAQWRFDLKTLKAISNI